jgi:hypothetical protein
MVQTAFWGKGALQPGDLFASKFSLEFDLMLNSDTKSTVEALS